MFCYHNKRILLHKYQQNIFVDLTKLFSQCVTYSAEDSKKRKRNPLHRSFDDKKVRKSK